MGPIVTWGNRLFGSNSEEQKQIYDMTRIFFAYLGHNAINLS
jgi:hypothetical protein